MLGLGLSRLGLGALIAGAALLPVGVAAVPHGVSEKGRFKNYSPRGSRTTRHNTNGKRECERRQRQIARGQLRAANGLVTS